MCKYTDTEKPSLDLTFHTCTCTCVLICTLTSTYLLKQWRMFTNHRVYNTICLLIIVQLGVTFGFKKGIYSLKRRVQITSKDDCMSFYI